MMSPRIDANPPSPPNSPLPNSMPIRPAPRRPVIRPPKKPKPGRLKKPAGPLTGARVAMPGDRAPGVIVRLIGAAFGVVAVGAGAEYAREPREPTLARGRA